MVDTFDKVCLITVYYGMAYVSLEEDLFRVDGETLIKLEEDIKAELVRRKGLGYVDGA